MDDSTEFYVDIISHETSETIKSLGPYYSERLAERAELGLGYQLDHARFYSQQRKEDAK